MSDRRVSRTRATVTMRTVSAAFALLLLFGAGSACSNDLYFSFVKKDTLLKSGTTIPPKKLKLISFFINSKFSWYGERDRFYGYFYKLKPVIEYFEKQCLSGLNVFFNPRDDFGELAKKHKIKLDASDDYTSGKRQIIPENFNEYYRLFKQLENEGTYYLIIENDYSVIMSGPENRASLLRIYLYILDSESNIVFSRQFKDMHVFSTKDYQRLVSWMRYDRNKVQKRIMQLFMQQFIKITPKIIRELGKIVALKTGS